MISDISKLQPGQTVWDAHTHRMGNTTQRTLGVWEVRIESVDVEKQTVVGSWNNNPPEKFYRRSWSKWRLKKPVTVRNGYHCRLATRDEIKTISAETKSQVAPHTVQSPPSTAEA